MNKQTIQLCPVRHCVLFFLIGCGMLFHAQSVSFASVKATAAGQEHSLFMTEAGDLYAVGCNTYGQLGDGTKTGRLSFVPVASNVRAVAAGANHSLYITLMGDLYVTGKNAFGQLGDGMKTDRSSFVLVASNVKAVAAGDNHSLYIMENGDLYVMGWNGYGQLGNGSLGTGSSVPVKVASNVKAIAGGADHSLYITESGDLYAMGRGEWFGTGTASIQWAPVFVASNVKAITAGSQHSLYVTENGDLYVMGGNTYGQLGDGTTISRPLPVKVASNVKTVAANGLSGYTSHSLYVTKSGELYAMGGNDFGQLGDGTIIRRSTPVPVASNVKIIAAGGRHSLYVTELGELYSVGYNGFGQLGDGTTIDRHEPVIVAGIVNIAAISGITAPAWNTSPVTTITETMQYTGNVSWEPALIDGKFAASTQYTATITLVPKNVWSLADVPANFFTVAGATSVTNFAGSGIITAVFPRTESTCPLVVKSAMGGTVSGTTAGDYVQGTSISVTAIPRANFMFDGWTISGVTVANPNSETISFAMPANGVLLLPRFVFTGTGAPTDVVAVAAGYWHSLFLTAAGDLYAMGSNTSGQLGDGTTTKRLTPVKVSSNVKAMAAGSSHSLYITDNGDLYGMGDSSYYQLSSIILGGYLTPVKLESNVKAIAAGSKHTLYVKEDGTLCTWGYNEYGQLGVKTGTSVMPGTFVVASNVKSVAAGENHSLYVTEEGALYAMGYNNSGQLGDGTTTSRSSPVRVRPPSSARSAAAGQGHSFYLTDGGGLNGVGNNQHHQLTSSNGGTTENRLAFVSMASDVRAVAAGYLHSLYVTWSGGLYGRGYNGYGQLGTGETVTSLGYAIASNVKAVAAGQYHSLYVTESGKLYTMGYNNSGQLGDGTTIDRAQPVKIELPPMPVSIAAISGVVAPVRNEVPTAAITETRQYTGTVSWSPALVGGKFAGGTAYTATITLTAKSGYTFTGVPANFFTVVGATSVNNAENSGVITVVFPATSAPPTPAQSWRERNFGTMENSGLAADKADPDLDGVPNLLEYAFGTDPLFQSSASGKLPSGEAVKVGGEFYLTYTFSKNPEATDLVYTPQVSSDLKNWFSDEGNVTVVSSSDTEATVVDGVSMSVAPRYMRVFVAMNDDSTAAVATVPVGGMVHSVASGKIGFFGLPFARPAVWRGLAGAVIGSVIEGVDADWVNGEFVVGPHYLEILEGESAGLSLDVVTNTARMLAVDGDLSGADVSGRAVAIRPHNTLSSVFGETNEAGLQGGANVGVADVVLFFNVTTQSNERFYYKSSGIGGTGWRGATSQSLNQGQRVIAPHQGMGITRQGAGDLSFAVVGEARVGRQLAPVFPGYNWMAATQPLALTLGQSGLWTDEVETGLRGGTLTDADMFMLWRGSFWERFYFKTSGIGGTGWRSSTSQSVDCSGETLAPGTFFIIQRKAEQPFFYERPAAVVSEP